MTPPEATAFADLDRLRSLFPTAVSATGIDWKVLEALAGQIDPDPQTFGLVWPGKRQAEQAAQSPPTAKLTTCREESFHFDVADNLFVEGDNLEVLKLLENSHAERIKLIYIDPPYNTGGQFVYSDDFRAGPGNPGCRKPLPDVESESAAAPAAAAARRHARWLSMMYPRLILARRLLRPDGVIFISIDDNEVHHLRQLMAEIFGEENFVAQLVWSAGRKNDSKLISVSHEYVVCFARDLNLLKEQKVTWRQRKAGLDKIYAVHQRLRRRYGTEYETISRELKAWYRGLPHGDPAKRQKHYNQVDARGIYFPDNLSWPGGGGPTYEVLHPVTRKPCRVPSRGWVFARPDTMQKAIDNGQIHFGPDESTVPCRKSYLRDREFQVPYSVSYRDGRAATKRLRTLMDGHVFDHPKDEMAIRELLEFATRPGDTVLDFFAGSCSTAHAVLQLNRDSGANRSFIMVQQPESLPEDSTASRAGYGTIADVGKERIRRVLHRFAPAGGGNGKGAPPGQPSPENSAQGFRVLKLEPLQPGRQPAENGS